MKFTMKYFICNLGITKKFFSVIVAFVIFLIGVLLAVDIKCMLFSPTSSFDIQLNIIKNPEQLHLASIGNNNTILEVKTACITQKSFIASRTIVSQIWIDGKLVKYLWWPASDLYNKEYETFNTQITIGEGSLVILPRLCDGKHHVKIISKQYKSKYLIKSTYNLSEHNFYITCPCPGAIAGIED